MPPRFSDIKFRSIGQQPELLKRMSAPDPEVTYQEEQSPSSSPSSRILANNSTSDLSPSRLSLLQTLADPVVDSISSTEPISVKGNMSNILHIEGHKPSGLTVDSNSGTQSVSPTSQENTNSTHNKNDITALHDMYNQLLSKLSSFPPPNSMKALLIAQSARNSYTAVCTAAREAHSHAQLALASVRNSLAAAQDCFRAADNAQVLSNELLTAIELLGHENTEQDVPSRWKVLFTNVDESYHHLRNWVKKLEDEHIHRTTALAGLLGNGPPSVNAATDGSCPSIATDLAESEEHQKIANKMRIQSVAEEAIEHERLRAQAEADAHQAELDRIRSQRIRVEEEHKQKESSLLKLRLEQERQERLLAEEKRKLEETKRLAEAERCKALAEAKRKADEKRETDQLRKVEAEIREAEEKRKVEEERRKAEAEEREKQARLREEQERRKVIEQAEKAREDQLRQEQELKRQKIMDERQQYFNDAAKIRAEKEKQAVQAVPPDQRSSSSPNLAVEPNITFPPKQAHTREASLSTAANTTPPLGPANGVTKLATGTPVVPIIDTTLVRRVQPAPISPNSPLGTAALGSVSFASQPSAAVPSGHVGHQQSSGRPYAESAFAQTESHTHHLSSLKQKTLPPTISRQMSFLPVAHFSDHSTSPPLAPYENQTLSAHVVHNSGGSQEANKGQLLRARASITDLNVNRSNGEAKPTHAHQLVLPPVANTITQIPKGPKLSRDKKKPTDVVKVKRESPLPSDIPQLSPASPSPTIQVPPAATRPLQSQHNKYSELASSSATAQQSHVNKIASVAAPTSISEFSSRAIVHNDAYELSSPHMGPVITDDGGWSRIETSREERAYIPSAPSTASYSDPSSPSHMRAPIRRPDHYSPPSDHRGGYSLPRNEFRTPPIYGESDSPRQVSHYAMPLNPRKRPREDDIATPPPVQRHRYSLEVVRDRIDLDASYLNRPAAQYDSARNQRIFGVRTPSPHPPLSSRLAPRGSDVYSIGRGESYRPKYSEVGRRSPDFYQPSSYYEHSPLKTGTATSPIQQQPVTRTQAHDSRPELLSRFTETAPISPQLNNKASRGRNAGRLPRGSFRGRGGGRGGGNGSISVHSLEQRMNSRTLMHRLESPSKNYP